MSSCARPFCMCSIMSNHAEAHLFQLCQGQGSVPCLSMIQSNHISQTLTNGGLWSSNVCAQYRWLMWVCPKTNTMRNYLSQSPPPSNLSNTDPVGQPKFNFVQHLPCMSESRLPWLETTLWTRLGLGLPQPEVRQNDISLRRLIVTGSQSQARAKIRDGTSDSLIKGSGESKQRIEQCWVPR